jgi:7-cyano-7-deazaguanine synthase in queuosine biosynthesis
VNIYESKRQVYVVDVSVILHCLRAEHLSLSYDIVCLVSAIHAIDRVLEKRPKKGYRKICLTMPVGNVEKLDTVRTKFESALEWLTHDKWQINFEKYPPLQKTILHQQEQLELLSGEVNFSHSALWSGGLDSFTGVFNYLSENPDARLLLVGSGCCPNDLHRLTCLGNDIKRCFPNKIRLLEVPLQIIEGHQKNSYARTRGLLFSTLGILAASKYTTTHKLLAFENGIGAINAPMIHQVFDDMSHSVHPLTLHLISEIYSILLEENLAIENPVLFDTKAQMCRKAVEYGCPEELLLNTHSCDSKGREPGTPHCGVCSSCILRRVSLRQSIGKEDNQYGNQTKNRMEEIHRLQTWAKETYVLLNEGTFPDYDSTEFWGVLQSKPDVSEIKVKLRELYRTYCNEVFNSIYDIAKVESNREQMAYIQKGLSYA